jgi:hypothetical protein
MADKEDNKERTLDELEALKSILGEQCVQIRAPAASSGAIHVELIAHAPQATLLATLNVVLPADYPSHAPPNITVVTDVPGFEHCTHHFSNIWAEAEGEVCLYSMMEWLNLRLSDLESDNTHAKEEEQKLKQQEDELLRLLEQQQQQTIQNSYRPTHFGRRCIYTHHTIASSKRTAVLRTALQLGLSGISKIGWPGVIVVEGDELACQEYVRYLSGLRWKQLTVRGEEVIEIVVDDTTGVHTNEDLIDGMRKFPKGMSEFGEKQMSEAATACREAGLEDLFKTAMKIYN